jgi:hypothetical protein
MNIFESKINVHKLCVSNSVFDWRTLCNYNASFIAGTFVYDSHLIKYVNEVWED